jgi:hypothetical protein
VVGHARLSEFDFEGARDRPYVSALILPVCKQPLEPLNVVDGEVHYSTPIVSRHRSALISPRKNILLIV